jgi:hypothetical protein
MQTAEREIRIAERGTAREAWSRPVLRTIAAGDSEFGPNYAMEGPITTS